MLQLCKDRFWFCVLIVFLGNIEDKVVFKAVEAMGKFLIEGIDQIMKAEQEVIVHQETKTSPLLAYPEHNDVERIRQIVKLWIESNIQW